MRYGGSEAYVVDGAAVGYNTRASRDFVTLEGGRLDADVRRGVPSNVPSLLIVLVVLVVTLFVVGGASVALTSGTVALLQSNEALSSEIKEMRASNGELRNERSLLVRADRISRIATQNLGMVYANDAKVLHLG